MNKQEVERLEKAKDIVHMLTPVDGFYGILKCPSSKGNGSYTIDLMAETCTCPDYQIRGGFQGFLCKHLLAAKIKLGIDHEKGEKFTISESEYSPAEQEAGK